MKTVPRLASLATLVGILCLGGRTTHAQSASPDAASLGPRATLQQAAILAQTAAAKGFPLPSRLVRNPDRGKAPSIDELRVELVRERGLRETLGESRVRRLRYANFRMHLDTLRPDEELRYQQDLFEGLTDDYRSNYAKLARDWAETKLGLHSLLQRREQRRSTREETGFGLRVSPQLGSGDDPYLGAKLRLRGVSPFLGRFSFHTRHRFETGEQMVRLSFQDRLHFFSLERRAETPERGDEVLFSMRWTF
jgi:hypothetical protein